MSDLRPYQTAAIDGLRRAIASGSRAPVLAMATGAGKTHISKAMIASAEAKGRSVLFLAPRRELIYQTCEKLDDAGVRYGVIMAGERPASYRGVQVACVPSLYRRISDGRITPPAADLVVLDECHMAISATTRDLLAFYQRSVKIGLTATPVRTDGRGLGEVFDSIVLGPSVRELTDGGYLVPARYFAGRVKADLSGVKLQAGDYSAGELGDRMDRTELVGDVVSNWLRLASDRKTIVFAVNVRHSLHLRERFAAAGVSTAHIDASTPHGERAEILCDIRHGSLQVLVNVDVATYGIDIPAVSCCVLARPTKSLVRYLQSVGRALRPYTAKSDCTVLDHGLCVDDLGFVDDDRTWTLDGATKADREAKREERDSDGITCPNCEAIFRRSRTCPECGHDLPARAPKAIVATDDDLTELDRAKRRQNREWTMAEKGQFFAELKGHAARKGYAEGWASHKYRERFGVWPTAVKHMPPHEPSAETLAWITHLNIRHAKRRAA